MLDAAAQKLQRVQSDKDLFTKLPSRSYSNLAQQPRTGLLSQLLKPDSKIIEMRRTQTMVDVRGAAQPPPLLGPRPRPPLRQELPRPLEDPPVVVRVLRRHGDGGLEDRREKEQREGGR